MTRACTLAAVRESLTVEQWARLERINPHLDPPAILLQFFRVLSERGGLGPPTDLHHGLGRAPLR